MKKTKTEIELQEKGASDEVISSFLEKNKRIKKETQRLKKLFIDIDENKKKLVQTTIEDVAFMTVTLEDLSLKIAIEGATSEYKNGENQYGTKQSPEVQTYMQMMQRKTNAMKILLDCLPKTAPKQIEQDDGFENFVLHR